MAEVLERKEQEDRLINGQVFVIDDDEAARESIAALVEVMGVPVQTFSCAEDFLNSSSIFEPGCVVTDLRMLGMSGVELIRHLRARDVETPVILVSAYADIAIAVEAMTLGAFRVIEKPYRDQELWDCIVGAMRLAEQQVRDSTMRDSLNQRLARLTASELDVLRLLLKGMPNKQISRELDLSPRTVDLRRRSILDNMEFENIVELAAVLGRYDVCLPEFS